ncbi:Trk system potassium transporter TrkA [Cuneatibacter sp. NSJ-177]|uniref:Trk system potassium transporter TrkA n=1 Tax=Cuneatibacter sp. NSJ-177 TaxID=2931401 RepID=UPI001FD574D8|nr:Trk system potassium transporter TrkA [Cuneatibacter sp. NSJ-177]MCJ7835448.1 Trk system potassium transporter TrkA [Cuneatibacter sp. NSJ-177]
MKIIIMGSGKVGHKLVEQLAQEGHDIVVIDSNPAALQALVDTEDVMCVEGNAVDYQVQLEAGISEADLVIACTDGDELNMLCCLLARKHGAARTIARVRKPEYYDQLPFIREEMGLSFAINPERASANVISRVLIFPAATSIEPFAKGRVELMEFALDAGNALIGKSLVEINKRFSFRVLICAVQRGQEVFIPGGSDVLEAGDRIYLVSSHDELQSFFKEIDLFRSSVKNVMIVGGGKISYYLAKRLLFQGMHVKIIEQNMERCRELCEQLPAATVVCGDGSHEELLLEEGIQEVDAFVAMTGMDEINAILSLYAKTRNVSKIITKVTQLSFTEMLEKIGIQTIISPKEVTANQIVRYVRAVSASVADNSVESLSRLIGGRLEALEFLVEKKAPFTGIPLKDLSIQPGFLVACIVRDRELIIPGGNDTIEEDDTVILVTTRPHVKSLHEMLA